MYDCSLNKAILHDYMLTILIKPWIKVKLSKIQDTKPPHTLVLQKRTAYLMYVLYDIGHNLLIPLISKLS